MLLFEKIARGGGGKKPGGGGGKRPGGGRRNKSPEQELRELENRRSYLEDQVARNKENRERSKARQEEKNFYTFPDGTRVDKRHYKNFDFGNLQPSGGTLPTENYLYKEVKTPDQAYHNYLVSARERGPQYNVWDRLSNAYHEHKMDKIDQHMYDLGREVARERHALNMETAFQNRFDSAQRHAEEMRRSKLQAMGVLGAGGAIGGGALLMANNAATPLPAPVPAPGGYMSPAQYEQDYYH